MCGICGIATTRGPVDADRLRGMARTLYHRGPDSEGMHVDGAKEISEPRGEERYCRDCWEKKIAVEEIVAREFALKRYIRAHSAEKYLIYHSTIKRPCGQLIVVDDGYDLFLTLMLYPNFAWDEPAYHLEQRLTLHFSNAAVAVHQLTDLKAFYRGRNTNQIQGNGLGLYLVKTTVEAIGGRVSVLSSAGSGARFYLYLPTVPEVSNG